MSISSALLIGDQSEQGAAQRRMRHGESEVSEPREEEQQPLSKGPRPHHRTHARTTHARLTQYCQSRQSGRSYRSLIPSYTAQQLQPRANGSACMLRWAKIQGLPSSSMQSHRVSGERSAAQRGQLATDRLSVRPRHTRRRCTPERTDRTGRDRTDRQAPARAASKPANLSATGATAILMPGRPRHGKLHHAPAPHRTVASHSHRWQRSRARASSSKVGI
ncbi:hypothetical protein IWZ03DRAFT_199267 [Phyllosticta citriasiana]|uniref:Uncharacterized protein n=1 Tax=Phyllosticta citriasiana TaxID=595635 RepID=A0ABR1KMP7_9PEZI